MTEQSAHRRNGGLPRPRWTVVVGAPFLLALAEVLLVFGSFSLAQRVLVPVPPGRSRGGRRNSLDQLRADASGVRSVAARLPFRSDCLRQALITCRIARRAGYDAEIELGVDGRTTQLRDGRFEGHAWVEVEGDPLLLDDAALTRVARFAGNRSAEHGG